MIRKQFFSGMILLLFCAGLFAQAVKDRNVIPVAVNLNQVLRMTVTNGGNIEFNFNTIDAYKSGLSGDVATTTADVAAPANIAASEGLYQTDFTVASSTRWNITYGAEMATFIGTDNPANTLTLDNVGFSITSTGAHTFETGIAQGTTDAEELWSTATASATEVTALEAYPVVIIEDNDSPTDANAGDATDNAFTLAWRCGTTEGTTTPMNAAALIDQQPSPTPDRYVVNVIFELAIDN
jgi:hypothetical protein